METAAAFLESRRVAAMMGATTEFEKEEGITYSSKHNKVSSTMQNEPLFCVQAAIKPSTVHQHVCLHCQCTCTSM
jgi:hypothetical protein